MSNSERAIAARMATDPVALEAGRSVAALFDVLDRAAGGSVYARPHRPRPATHRATGTRTGGVRTVPLRSVQPAPSARPAPGATRTAGTAAHPVVVPGRLHSLVRRAALWGAGPQGQHLAWRPAARPAAAVAPAAARAATPPDGSPAPRRRLARRVALWGAGPSGEHLAWGGPSRQPVKPEADRPVVLREMPSTPTIGTPTGRTPRVQIPTVQPAAPSPAAVLFPHGPASTGPRWMPPVPRGAVAVPGIRPSGRPERSQATGWPPQVPGAGVATGLVRTRGDPLPCPARGSPAPARRSVPPGSFRSSFP